MPAASKLKECSRRGCPCEVKYKWNFEYYCTFHVPFKKHAIRINAWEEEL